MSESPAKLWHRLTTDERVAAVKHAVKMGLSQAKIAERLGAAPSTIHLCARKHGIVLNAEVCPSRAWVRLSEPERVARFREAALRTPGYMALATVLGVKRDTVRKFAKKHGITVISGRGANLAEFNRSARVRKPRKATTPIATRDIPVSVRVEPTQPKPVDLPQPSRRPSPDVATRVHVTDHRTDQCRFPLWPDAGRTPLSAMFYCGAPIEEPTTSYCPSCRKLIRRGEITTTPEERAAFAAQMARARLNKTRAVRSDR